MSNLDVLPPTLGSFRAIGSGVDLQGDAAFGAERLEDLLFRVQLVAGCAAVKNTDLQVVDPRRDLRILALDANADGIPVIEFSGFDPRFRRARIL